MAKQIKDLREVLNQYMYDFDMLQRIDCSKEDNKKYSQLLKSGSSLPDGVFQHEDEQGDPMDWFYTIHETDLSDAEKERFLKFKKLSLLTTIRNCIVFFTVLTIINIIAVIITGVLLSTNI